MSQFVFWIEDADADLQKWAVKYWGELEAHIRHQIIKGEISDEVFTAVLQVCMPGGYSDAESFACDTSISQHVLFDWYGGIRLPMSDVRYAYLHICLAAAGRTSTAERVMKLLTISEPLPDILFGPSVEESGSEEISNSDSA